jgi:hypothetical protein
MNVALQVNFAETRDAPRYRQHLVEEAGISARRSESDVLSVVSNLKMPIFANESS